ncbi:MAG: dihydrolipoyl dehydrogenase [Synergistaceae bacterium]|nr:dihydrolipoyl dehydrogenase [Synergistaceae bacterium]
MSKRIVVIGGGPGGYVAAIRAAQLGASVRVVEKDRLGGTCLNAGCVPTKALLHSAELYAAVRREGPTIGIFADNLRFDWTAIMNRKKEVVNYLVDCVGGLLRSNGVERLKGTARLIAQNAVEVIDPDRKRDVIEADAVIVATGSEPAVPPIPGLDSEGVMTSDGALSLDVPPKRVAIAGGGVIGLEFASIFSSFGIPVVVVEMLPRILPNIDAEIAGVLRRSLEGRGVVFHTASRLESVTRTEEGLRLRVVTESGPVQPVVDRLLVATGRRPYTKALGLEDLGVATRRGRIVTDARMETNVGGLYAVGDCASRIMLAHVASREGEVAAENAMGRPALMDYKTVPGAVYTSPAVASVGLSEDEARAAGHDVRVGRFPLAANGKSVIAGDVEGMVKIVSDGRWGEVLGVHIAGGPATDMIAEGALALRLEATLDEIVSTVHAHPTVSEAVGEAALASWAGAIHLPKPAAS